MLIAQISDFHVTPPDTLLGGVADTRSAFRACIAHLAALQPQPDLVLITGDLTETGSDEEYAFVAEGLHSLGVPFRAIPGNHDLRAPMRRALPEATGREPNHLACVLETDALRFVGLDTLVEGQPYGALYADQMDWLDAALGEACATPTVVFMHHPPFATGIAAMDTISLTIGREALEVRLAQRTDIVALLCGHVHRPIAGRFAGIPAFIAPSASHGIALDLAGGAPLRFVREPPQIALHRWHGGKLVTHVSYVQSFNTF